MIIVTGATCFIGSNIVADLNARGPTDLLLVDNLGTEIKWRNIAKRRFLNLIDYRDLDALLRRLRLHALPSHCRGRKFETCIAHQKNSINSCTYRDVSAFFTP